MARALTFDVDAVVFDLDGTLLDSERAITEAGALAFRDIGVDVTPAQIAEHLGAPLEELYTTFSAANDEREMRHFVARYIAIHDEHPDRFPPPLPGVVEGLRALCERGLPLAVATTKPSDRARVQLEGAGLVRWFKHIQGTDPGMKPKPAPDVVLAACKGLGVVATRALMIGDTTRDIAAGKAAGARTAVVAYAPERELLARTWSADAVLTTLAGL
ncbi:MAG TPA: HAD family hydrolase [Myxococcota bacterium]|jgi:HAD superfamily hydrolase (TIGR01509 family)